MISLILHVHPGLLCFLVLEWGSVLFSMVPLNLLVIMQSNVLRQGNWNGECN